MAKIRYYDDSNHYCIQDFEQGNYHHISNITPPRISDRKIDGLRKDIHDHMIPGEWYISSSSEETSTFKVIKSLVGLSNIEHTMLESISAHGFESFWYFIFRRLY